MSEIVERVARAMAEKPSGSRDSAIWLNLSEHSKDYFLQLARAAIEAMRVPLSRKLAAALSTPETNWKYNGRRMDDPDAWSMILQDIIDAALSEKS